MAPILIPFLEEKFEQIQLHFLVRERFRPRSRHLVFLLEQLWAASGRDPSGDPQSAVTQWGRFLKQNKLPADLAKGLCNMYIDLSPEILNAKTMEKYFTLVDAQQSGVIQCRAVLDYYDTHRAHLTTSILPYYFSETDDPELPLVTGPGWIPESPIPMGLPGSQPRFVYEAAAQIPPAARIPGLPATLHEVRRSLSPQGKMSNDAIYRPLDIEVTEKGLRLVCGPARYFDFHDSCEFLGLELSSWLRANPGRVPNPDGSDLPLRGPAENIFKLRHRCAVVGVSTLLIALDYEGSDWYFLHERGKEVAVNQGACSVVPSGTFQPFAANLAHHDHDFNIRSTILRELAEELLGKKEFQEQKKAGDFEREPILRDFVTLLNSNLAQIYFLGVGFDPVNTVPEVLTTFIFRAGDLPVGTIKKFKKNFEGVFDRHELSAEALRLFAIGPNVHTASAACARLASRKLDQLISEVRNPRLRATG